MRFQKIKTRKINLSVWEKKEILKVGKEIFYRLIGEDVKEEFKKFMNCDEELLKFRKKKFPK